MRKNLLVFIMLFTLMLGNAIPANATTNEKDMIANELSNLETKCSWFLPLSTNCSLDMPQVALLDSRGNGVCMPWRRMAVFMVIQGR